MENGFAENQSVICFNQCFKVRLSELMAARKRLRLPAKTRERSRASMLINRLQDHALGRCDMTPMQVKAASAVLRKTLPDLKPVKLVYEDAPRDSDAICASYDYKHARLLTPQWA